MLRSFWEDVFLRHAIKKSPGQEFQAELGQKQKELVQEYMKKIEEATSAVAKRHGFDVVIDKGSESTLKIVLYHRNGLDLTNEVVKEFNRRFK